MKKQAIKRQQFPESHSKSPLAIYLTYGTEYVSMLLSIRPPVSFSLCVHRSVLYVCVSVAALQMGSSVPSFKPGLCDNLDGWEIQERGAICILMTDAYWNMAETNTIL